MNVHEMHRAFMERVVIDDPEGCWTFTASLNEKGYGRFFYKGIAVRAHRFAAAGFRIPETDRFACHRCDNPPCVNPDHLFFATAKDNTLDMMQKGRLGAVGPTSETSRHRKLTRPLVEEIRRRYAAGETCLKELGREYGVTGANVSYIVKRKTWR